MTFIILLSWPARSAAITAWLLRRHNGICGCDEVLRWRPGWLARLDVPLPEAGGGIGAVVADLAEVVIPNGERVSEPGWSSFITTGPTHLRRGGVAGGGRRWQPAVRRAGI